MPASAHGRQNLTWLPGGGRAANDNEFFAEVGIAAGYGVDVCFFTQQIGGAYAANAMTAEQTYRMARAIAILKGN